MWSRVSRSGEIRRLPPLSLPTNKQAVRWTDSYLMERYWPPTGGTDMLLSFSRSAAAPKSTKKQSWAFDVPLHTDSFPTPPPSPFLPFPLSLPTLLSNFSSLCWTTSLPYSPRSGPQAETDLFNKRLAGWAAAAAAAVEKRLMLPFSSTGEWIPERDPPDGLGVTPGSPQWGPHGIALNIWIPNAGGGKWVTWPN